MRRGSCKSWEATYANCSSSDLNGERNELVGILVQFALVAPGKQLSIARNHAQGLLQVMGSHVRKLLQFGIGTGQFGGLRPQFGGLRMHAATQYDHPH